MPRRSILVMYDVCASPSLTAPAQPESGLPSRLVRSRRPVNEAEQLQHVLACISLLIQPPYQAQLPLQPALGIEPRSPCLQMGHDETVANGLLLASRASERAI